MLSDAANEYQLKREARLGDEICGERLVFLGRARPATPPAVDRPDFPRSLVAPWPPAPRADPSAGQAAGATTFHLKVTSVAALAPLERQPGHAVDASSRSTSALHRA